VTQRSLVIGLGLHSRTLLEATACVFSAHGHADDLQMLWLPPYPVESPLAGGSTYSLGLSRETLNALYYRSDIRATSSLNWKSWRERIPSNRLWGKLAAAHHLFELGNKITSLSKQLSTDGAGVSYWLVAHAHDPFASGALLDCAYLLNQIATERTGGHVYGIVLLPGIPGDPVISHDRNEQDLILRGACAYAALRELNFALGEHSFYDNYDSRAPLHTRNESPFQTGDCYLIGGSYDERRQTLDYDREVIPTTARWIFLRTCTSLRRQMTNSKRGHITAFDVYLPPIESTLAKVDVTRPVIAYLLRQILKADTSVGDTAAVDPWLLPHLEAQLYDSRLIAGNAFDAADVGRKNTRIDVLDAHYDAAVSRLTHLEQSLSRSARLQLDRAMADLDPQAPNSPLAKARSNPGTTLTTVQEYYRAVLTRAEANYEQYKHLLDELTERARAQRDTLLRQHDYYVYASTPFHSAFPLIIYLTLLSLMVFLMVIGLGLIGLVIGLGGVIGIRSIQTTFRSKRLREAEQLLTRAQRQLLQTQTELVAQRIVCAYAYEINLYLKNELQGETADSRAEKMGSYLQGLAVRLVGNHWAEGGDYHSAELTASTLGITEADWRDFAPKLTDRLWTRLRSNLAIMSGIVTAETDEGIVVEVRSLAHDESLLRPQEGDVEALCREIEEMVKHSAPTLLSLPTRIQEGERDYELQAVIFPEWNPRLITHLVPHFQGRGLEFMALYGEHEERPFSLQPTEPGLCAGNDNLSQLLTREFSVHARYNVPIAALADLGLWRTAYQNAIQVRVDGQDYCVRGLLHPTRAGAASPEPTPSFKDADWDDFLMAISEIAMLVAFLMRFHRRDDVLNRLCADLKLFRRANELPNLDDLSGALSESRDALPRLRRDSQPNTALTSADIEGTLSALMKQIDDEAPKFSERYADWELWIVDWLREIAPPPILS